MKKILFIFTAALAVLSVNASAATVTVETLNNNGSNIDGSGTLIWAWSYDVCETLSGSAWGGPHQPAGSTITTPANGITWTRDGEEANASAEEPSSWDFLDAGEVIVSITGLFTTNPHTGHLFSVADSHNTYTADMLDIMNEFLCPTVTQGPMTFTLNNLVVGLDYRLQILHDTKSGSVREQYVALRNDTNDADEVTGATFATTASHDTGKLSTVEFTASAATEYVQLTTVAGRSQFNAAVLSFVDEKAITATGDPNVSEATPLVGDTFDVVLDSAPSGNVTVTLNYDSDQVSLSDESLTFTTGDWNIAQVVTVFAVDDTIKEDPNHVSQIEVVPSGGGIAGIPAYVTVTIVDNDDVPPPMGTFFNADISNTAGADGQTPWYTFDAATDNLWRYRTDKDYFFDSDVLEQTNQTSGGFTDSRLAVTTITGLTSGTEYEIRAVFWARQLAEYNALAGLDPNELTLLCPEYYFTTTYTGELTRVKSDLTATGVVGDPSRLYEVNPLLGTAVADGSGRIKAYFTGVNLMDDNGANYADQRTWFEGFRYQEAKLDIVESDGSTGVTDITSDTFTVALASAPSATVTVDVAEIVTSDALGTITPATLTFTTGNWSTPQTVTVEGKAPPAGVDFYSSTVILEASSNDANYDEFFTTVYVQDVDCGIHDYNPMDFNTDCKVNIDDLAIIASQWLECTDPSNSNCKDGRSWNDPWMLP